MARIRFGLVGGGWRAEFFTRIVRELPEQFELVGVVQRDEAKSHAFGAKWAVPAFASYAELAGVAPDFVVVSVKADAHLAVLTDLHRLGLAVLCETPAALDVETMVEIWRLVEQGFRLHVAEQYLFQPFHSARLKLIHDGRLGKISFARVSTAHGYHGVSLMRRFLQLGFEDATIRGRQFASTVVEGGNRSGPPTAERIVSATQLLGEFDFGDRLGLFDFTDIQYWSYVRSHRVVIRGERGEIADNEVRHLLDFRTPVTETLRRRDRGQGGDLDGYYLDSILLGAETVFHNPFWRARLMDDEVAIATALLKMAELVRGTGPGPYPYAEAAQDQYLSLLLNKAAKSGETIRSTRQPWAG